MQLYAIARGNHRLRALVIVKYTPHRLAYTVKALRRFSLFVQNGQRRIRSSAGKTESVLLFLHPKFSRRKRLKLLRHCAVGLHP